MSEPVASEMSDSGVFKIERVTHVWDHETFIGVVGRTDGLISLRVGSPGNSLNASVAALTPDEADHIANLLILAALQARLGPKHSPESSVSATPPASVREWEVLQSQLYQAAGSPASRGEEAPQRGPERSGEG